MKWILFLSVFFIMQLCISSVPAQDIKMLKMQADKLESIPNEKAALNKFKEILKLDPLNLYALTKCSELCSRIAGRELTIQTRETYNQAAIIYARTALKYYPNSEEANVAMAIAVGRTVIKKTGKEKLAAIKDIKLYADMALKANPNSFKAWHVLGKWNYEIASLSGLERAVAKVFYGTVPDASINKSIAAYERARAINPGFALNYLELAKAYEKNNNRKKAVALLRTVLTIPVQTEDDPRIKREAGALIHSWEK